MRTKIISFEEYGVTVLEVLEDETYNYYFRYPNSNDFVFEFGVDVPFRKKELRSWLLV